MKLLRRSLYFPLLLIGGLLLWGLVEPYLIDVQEEEVVLPNLPQAWEGKQVAQMSDWQVGMWFDNTWTIRRVVRSLVEHPPEAVLITGDFIYHADQNSDKEIEEAVALVSPLVEAGIPTYTVLGNHDYSVDKKDAAVNAELAERLERALEEAGIRVLTNEVLPLESRSELEGRFFVAGVGSHWADRSRPEETLSTLAEDVPRIVLMHHPDSFERVPANAGPMTLAGHTHGGQIRIPFLPQTTWLTFARGEKVHSDGWVESDYGAPGNRLYVNRGIGFSNVPIRINCRPELTRFTLRRDSTRSPASQDSTRIASGSQR